jgi:hypothetical protein
MTRKPTIIAFSNFIFKREDPSPNADLRRLAVLELNGQKINESNPIVAINFKSEYTYRLHSYLEKQSIVDTNQKPLIDFDTLFTLTKDFNLLAQLKVITTNPEKTGEASDDFNIILTNYPNFNWLNELTGIYSMPATPQYTATTRPNSRIVSTTQPLLLSTLLNFNEGITNLKVQAIATFEDNSIYQFTTTELNNQVAAGINVNPHIITLTTTITNILTLIDTNLYPKEVKSITLTILADGSDYTNQSISEPQTYYIDHAFYPEEQIIIYKNQIGVYDVLRTTGQTMKDNDRTVESFTNNNTEKDLKIKNRKKLSINLGIENADQSVEICEAISASKNIYLLENKQFIQIILASNSLKPYDSNKQADDPTLEFKYAQIT